MTYGGTPPVVIPAYSGFVNGETRRRSPRQPTCSTTATSSSPASPPTYPATCSGATDPNYAITLRGGRGHDRSAPLTITASNGSMTYGGTPPAITPAYGGFVNGDSASSLTTKPTCSTDGHERKPGPGLAVRLARAPARRIPTTPSRTWPGSVTVIQAPLTVTASSPTMTYGGRAHHRADATPGFVNGDSASSLTSAPTCSTTATSTSPVAGSPYASSCSGAVDPNYAFAYVAGHGDGRPRRRSRSRPRAAP